MERIDIRLQGMGRDTSIGRTTFDPPTTTLQHVHAPLHSGALPNGTYTVTDAITVRNP